MICDDCRIAETDRLHAIYWPGRPCCDARNLLAIPARFRRSAAEAIRGADPVHWEAVRARLEVLMTRDDAPGTDEKGPRIDRRGVVGTSGRPSATERASEAAA
jgi:hypothetical protein